MSTIMPHDELFRKAVAWICAAKEESEDSIPALVEKAAVRFNLGPKDSEFLVKFLREHPDGDVAFGA